jgi:acyl carrier protein
MDKEVETFNGTLDEESMMRLENIFTDLLWRETLPIREHTRLKCIGWDSIVQLELLTSIEQEFNVTLSDQDAEELNSFAVACQILAEKRRTV